mmetsp:Transcript_47311/g.145951  ORF Transcript_47311/g.145951 Transcript_47311/m.145951 type:complete len:324 (+) Transcript_47311:496-1467(+)
MWKRSSNTTTLGRSTARTFSRGIGFVTRIAVEAFVVHAASAGEMDAGAPPVASTTSFAATVAPFAAVTMAGASASARVTDLTAVCSWMRPPSCSTTRARPKHKAIGFSSAPSGESAPNTNRSDTNPTSRSLSMPSAVQRSPKRRKRSARCSSSSFTASSTVCPRLSGPFAKRTASTWLLRRPQSMAYLSMSAIVRSVPILTLSSTIERAMSSPHTSAIISVSSSNEASSCPPLRPLAPLAMRRASSTHTLLPRSASATAACSPAMPPPMTHTSYDGGDDGDDSSAGRTACGSRSCPGDVYQHFRRPVNEGSVSTSAGLKRLSK